MTEVAIVLIVVLAVVLGAGIWIGMALMATGGIALMLFRSMPVEALLGQIVWNTVTLSELVSLPLFVLMAEILFRTKLAASMFDGLAPWTSRLPGRLLHINVLACTLFAAVSGSSAATAATVGRITLDELAKRGYDRKLSIGSLAGAGTLGFLIPPSIVMIVYGVLSNTSILKLFIAGVAPGLMLAVLFMGWIAARAKLDPSLAPIETGRVGWRERLRSLPKLLPVLLLIGAIIGSMYAGWASPNEAAIIGVLGSLAIAGIQRTLTRRHFFDALMGTVMITCMIGLILAGAAFLSSAVGFLGIANQVAAGITGLGLGKFGLVLLLLLIYVILGCFLDGISCIVMTIPITLPLIVAAGFDPIWFGIFLVITVEMAQVTPPVGFNLYVLQGLSGESMGAVAKAALPFFFIMVLFALLLAIFPDLVMWVPNHITLRG